MNAARTAGSGSSSAALLADKGAAIRQQNKQRNNTPVKNALRRISNIFVPLIPALIACGLIAGINGILTNLATTGAVPWLANLSPILSVMSTGFFALLAVFVAMNAAKEFGGTPIIGGVIGATVVAFLNSGRLGVDAAKRRLILLTGLVGLVAVVAVSTLLDGDADVMSSLRVVTRVVAVLCCLVQLRLQRPMDRAFQLRGTDYGSLWGVGIAAAIGGAVVETLILLLVTVVL